MPSIFMLGIKPDQDRGIWAAIDKAIVAKLELMSHHTVPWMLDMKV